MRSLLERPKSLAGTLVLLAVVGACPLASQEAARPVAAKPDAAFAPVFDVSTIKPNKSGSRGDHSSMRDGRYVATNMSLKNVMEYEAYEIPSPRIVGGAKWMGSEKFDIEAKMESGDAVQLKALDREQRRAATEGLFQRFLADRFKLAVHWETREMPIYTLVVDKKGPTLTTAQDTAHGIGTHARDGMLTTTNTTMADFAETLTQEVSDELGRVVVDKTGISGGYDVTLKWTPDTTTGGDLPADAPPPLLTAIQEQLGLRLESSKGMVKVLVIDHAEMPTEN